MRTEEELKSLIAERMADYEPPSNEQLANFAAVKMDGSTARAGEILSLMETLPTLVLMWRQAHRVMQEDVYLMAIAVDDVNEEVIERLGFKDRVEGRNEI